jgi:hypothetical protein
MDVEEIRDARGDAHKKRLQRRAGVVFLNSVRGHGANLSWASLSLALPHTKRNKMVRFATSIAIKVHEISLAAHFT